MKMHHPSILLVETWIQLARNDSFPEAQHFSIRRLETLFGSISEAELYLETENPSARAMSPTFRTLLLEKWYTFSWEKWLSSAIKNNEYT
jgi:hypothetical protein